MQFSKATLVAVLAALVQAESIQDLVGQIPTCATTCLTTAIAASGCGLVDYVCQCSPPAHNTILAKGAPCVQSSCSTNDALTTTNVTNQICQIALAGSSSTSGSAGASSSASSAASSSSAAAGMSTTGSSSSPSVTSSAASSVASSAASAASSVASSAASKASSAAGATSTSNAGKGFNVGAGMMGAAVIAAIAL